MTTTNPSLPRTIQEFVDQARATGYQVTVAAWVNGYDITCTHADGRTGAGNWAVMNVAPMNSRLGFATEHKEGLRFQYGSAYVPYARQKHVEVQSIRRLKIALGIPTV
jgi:hypothetical protein